MSSTINMQNGATAARRSPTLRSSALLYPTLLIAGIAVIIASMLGIAAMTGLLSPAQSQSVAGRNDGKAADAKTRPAKVGGTEAVDAKTAGGNAAPSAAARCTDCGVVDSVRAVEIKGEGSGVGAVAGGVVGGILGNQVGGGGGRTAMTVVGAGAGAYAGHELEKNMKKNVSYEIRVRMDDHSYRTFHAAQPDVGVGQRVKVRDGQLVNAG